MRRRRGAYGIDRLDLDDAVTAAAAHAQDMPGNFREAPVPGWVRRFGSDRAAPARWNPNTRQADRRRPWRTGIGRFGYVGLGSEASFSICLGVGMRQLAGLSLMFSIRT
jgi:hypothetical protein